ncbi:tetratricopeptide repeat protein [Haliangium ochraceum]|uniref:tetratricopeptide repeat protein n=1 Tax=Haliangium ochraceum TaxID=80816 RepID=UPI0018EF5941|nr:tetratricopeptide repeat protein [Haliangium ochraceum]
MALAASLLTAPALHAQEAPPADEAEQAAEPAPQAAAEFQPEEGQGEPGSPTLSRATELYDKSDYYSASIEFKKVIDGQTNDTDANKQRAEFFMGKTLYQLGFYAGALAYFDRIAAVGVGHRYHNATLKWLAALSRVLPETSGILEKVGAYDPSELEQPELEDVSNELFYLLGRHYYLRGEFDQAIALFTRVEREDPFYLRAKFFEGVTYVRKFEGKPAVDAFKELLVIGREYDENPERSPYDGRDVRKFEELAILQMARVFYSTQQYDTSIKYYEKLTQSSPDWLASLFEASWAYFMKTNNSKALGNIHTLNAPYFEDEFFPESTVLKAVIYYKYCLYDRALEAIAEYDTKYRPLRDKLRDVLGKHEDDADFFGYVSQIRGGEAGLDEDTQRLVLSALEDRTLRKTFSWVDELDREMELHSKADEAWRTTQIANEVLQELTLQRSLSEADAGKLARERIERLSRELREFGRDSIKIRIEVLNAQAGQISAEARGERISGDHREERIVVDDEHFMWKFNGEYWKDELGYYRFRIRSQCPRSGAAQ